MFQQLRFVLASHESWPAWCSFPCCTHDASLQRRLPRVNISFCQQSLLRVKRNGLVKPDEQNRLTVMPDIADQGASAQRNLAR
jgi:hypothetical protein